VWLCVCLCAWLVCLIVCVFVWLVCGIVASLGICVSVYVCVCLCVVCANELHDVCLSMCAVAVGDAMSTQAVHVAYNPLCMR
jgi:hypothetical protein